MDLILAFAAGALTLINPCVLPVLPVVLAGALQSGRLGPFWLALGMSGSFVMLGVTVSAFGHALGVNEDDIARIGAWAMLAFGAVLLVPRLGAGFAAATAGFAAQADAGIDRVGRDGALPMLAGGALLGAVWSPCIGPTLGGAIALASTGQSLGWVTAVMAAFALGVSAVMLALAYGTRTAILSRRYRMARLAAAARPLMGAALVLTGTAILLRWHHAAEAWLTEALPGWLIDLSVSI